MGAAVKKRRTEEVGPGSFPAFGLKSKCQIILDLETVGFQTKTVGFSSLQTFGFGLKQKEQENHPIVSPGPPGSTAGCSSSQTP